MPKFSTRVPHTLSREEATARLDRFVEVLRDNFKSQVSDLAQSWDGDTLRFSFKTYGIPLQGGVTVADDALNVDGELPFSAMMFKGKIESAIHDELAKLVAGD